MRPEFEGAEMQAGQQEAAEEEHEFQSVNGGDDGAFHSILHDGGMTGVVEADLSQAVLLGNVSQAAVVGDYDGDEEQGLHCGDHGTHEDAIISEFNAAIEAGDMGLARSMFTQIAQTMSRLSTTLDRVCEEKDRKEASVAELQAEVVEKYDDIRALSAAIANKERDIKDLNARMTHGRRVGAESSLRDAGDMGNNGIDGVFAEIPANGGGVAKFARDGGVTPIKSEREYVTTRADRRRTIALSGVQGRVERLSAGEVITAFSNNTGRLAPGRAAKVLDCQSRNVANWFYQRGGSVQSNVKAADVSGNGGRDDLPGHVLSAARPCHVLPSGESRHWWLRGASRPRGHQ